MAEVVLDEDPFALPAILMCAGCGTPYEDVPRNAFIGRREAERSEEVDALRAKLAERTAERDEARARVESQGQKIHALKRAIGDKILRAIFANRPNYTNRADWDAYHAKFRTMIDDLELVESLPGLNAHYAGLVGRFEAIELSLKNGARLLLKCAEAERDASRRAARAWKALAKNYRWRSRDCVPCCFCGAWAYAPQPRDTDTGALCERHRSKAF